jgi:hypothetical protein
MQNKIVQGMTSPEIMQNKIVQGTTIPEIMQNQLSKDDHSRNYAT